VGVKWVEGGCFVGGGTRGGGGGEAWGGVGLWGGVFVVFEGGGVFGWWR